MRQIPKFVRTRRGILVLAAVAAALLVEAAVVLAGASPLSVYNHSVRVPRGPVVAKNAAGSKVIVGHAVAHFRTPPLRSMTPAPFTWQPAHEASPNPLLRSKPRTATDPVVQRTLAPPHMPSPLMNFDGIPFPGVSCNCAPPD